MTSAKLHCFPGRNVGLSSFGKYSLPLNDVFFCSSFLINLDGWKLFFQSNECHFGYILLKEMRPSPPQPPPPPSKIFLTLRPKPLGWSVHQNNAKFPELLL